MVQFYHYLELHHSQTNRSCIIFIYGFYHYLELHHSQTNIMCLFKNLMFYHYLELHHSQTGKYLHIKSTTVLPLSGITSLSNLPKQSLILSAVLPLSGITSLSNLKFQSQFAYLLKSSTSKTAITWQCNSDMVKIYSKI